MPKRSAIQDVVEQFVERLSALIERKPYRVRARSCFSAFGGRAPAGIRLRGPGRPPR